MKTYFDDLAIFESMKPEDNKKVLKIFDFDGTLFYSPLPNRKLWDNKTFGKLWGDFSHGGYGWFQNELTLDDKYINPDDFIESTVKEVEKAMADPDAITILLTGRTTAFEAQIKKLLYNRGLEFDEYGFKPRDDFNPEFTMSFKQRFIRQLVYKYEPVAIEMWDDRFKHVKRFSDFLGTLDIKYEVHYVDIPDKGISDPELEKELVGLLMKDPRAGRKQPKKFHGEQLKKQKKERKPTFWAATLYPEDHYALAEQLKDEIPEGWDIVAHHMTIAFGKPKSDEVKKYTDENIGKDVNLTAVELGMSEQAMAVKINSNVPTDNNIPHITVALPKGGRAVKSNAITDWKQLPSSISLRAKISAEY